MKEYIKPEIKLVSFESENVANTGTSSDDGEGSNDQL